MLERLRRVVPAVVGLVLFLAALDVLRTELRDVTWRALTADLAAMPASRLAAAVLLAALNYLVLTAYDVLAFRYIGKRLPWRRIAVASFLAYAVSNSVGFAMLSGTSVRYRFYSRWGVSADELSKIVFAYVTTFWLGLLLVGGLSLAFGTLPREVGFGAAGLFVPVGWLLTLLSAGYVALSFARLQPIRIRRIELRLPPPGIAVAQLGVSVLDWLLAGGVLYVLLPPGTAPFPAFIAAFLAAQLVGLASHVPGGVGVFEGLMVLLLQPFIPSATLLTILIAYRAVYYLLPLSAALLVLVADEVRLRRAQAARFSATLGWLTEQLTPHVLAVFTFLAGVVLLFSGATPAATGRLRILDRVLPLGVIEASHFLGSIMGAALLVISQALARRLNAAFFLGALAIGVGIVTSLLKGADYEEAAVLACVLAVLWRARPAFDRRTALLDTRFSPEWIVAIVGALSATAWLGLFAFKHVEYSNELWWQFELRAEASRTLRAGVGAAVTLLLFAFGHLLGRARHHILEPSSDEIDEAGAIIAGQTSTFPYLVYLGDKALLFNEQKSAFVMYGVRGRSWIALGDPVGPADQMSPLIRLFVERCDDYGGIPVFYEISSEHLFRYADVGLTFVRLGEEARVDLSAFTVAGGPARRHRQALSRLEKTGATFRVIPPEGVGALMSQLRDVSDEWLANRAGAEKGFSLGFFDPAYVARFPVAVIERDAHVLAFATLWPGPQGVEISTDLMRFARAAPKDVMESLFVHLFLWGKAQGYRWFSLGMAPLSGFEASPAAPLWNRLASFLYEHGGAVYNFRGLRAYKEKFDPVWQPRYLAYPGGLHLPRILADVAALIAGGYRRIFLK